MADRVLARDQHFSKEYVTFYGSTHVFASLPNALKTWAEAK